MEPLERGQEVLAAHKKKERETHTHENFEKGVSWKDATDLSFLEIRKLH